jgi:hypothetical protein
MFKEFWSCIDSDQQKVVAYYYEKEKEKLRKFVLMDKLIS